MRFLGGATLVLALFVLTSTAQAQMAGKFAGTWLFRGIPGKICTIQEYNDGTIVATTEGGIRGQGRTLSDQEFYVDFPFARGLKGVISPDGSTITWANGERWVRQAPTQTTDVLGQWWDEYEVSGWHGTWTREGTTNTFDLAFVHPNGMRIGGKASITYSGSAIYVHRWNPNAPETCDYTGALTGNTVAGQYTCTLKGQVLGPYTWTATIMAR